MIDNTKSDTGKDLFIDTYGVKKYANLISSVPRGLKVSNSLVYKYYYKKYEENSIVSTIFLFLISFIIGYLLGMISIA